MFTNKPSENATVVSQVPVPESLSFSATDIETTTSVSDESVNIPLTQSAEAISVPLVASENVHDRTKLSGPALITPLYQKPPSSLSKDDVSDTTWSNARSTFRVDPVAPGGGVRIRFRIDTADESKGIFFRRIFDFLSGPSAELPTGEWMFGSVAEFERFVTEGGYRLGSHGKDKSAISTSH